MFCFSFLRLTTHCFSLIVDRRSPPRTAPVTTAFQKVGVTITSNRNRNRTVYCLLLVLLHQIKHSSPLLFIISHRFQIEFTFFLVTVTSLTIIKTATVLHALQAFEKKKDFVCLTTHSSSVGLFGCFVCSFCGAVPVIWIVPSVNTPHTHI